jgi:hypothetical protein
VAYHATVQEDGARESFRVDTYYACHTEASYHHHAASFS